MRAIQSRFSSMLRLVSVVTMVLLIITMFSCIAKAQTVDDSASVYKFVEAYQHTFNTRNPIAFSEFFTEDADFLMFNLPEIRGRQAIENFWRSYWSWI